MTLDEAYEEFSRIADTFSNPRYLAGELSQELDQLTYQMRRLAPVDSGRLKSSIALLAESTGQDLSVVLEMLEYGYYQNFGVDGVEGIREIRPLASTTASRRNPYGVDTPQGRIGDFEYNNRRYGLPATVFFDYDTLRDQIATIVEADLQNIVNETL